MCTIGDMKHNDWFNRITRGDSLRRVADVAAISDRTLSRQLREGELKADMVIRIAESYEESPIVSLIDLGFISARWMTETGVATALSRASDEELTDELLLRLKLLEKTPVDELAERRKKQSGFIAAEAHQHGMTFAVPPETLTDEQREYLEKSNKPATDVQPDGFDPLRHVTYSGPDEDAMRGYGEEDDDHIP